MTALPALAIGLLSLTAPARAEPPGVPPKVLHAEPLYIDLIRDLGARKGEREWNVGLGLIDRSRFDQYEALVEYEWAPANRLGLEVEVPLTFYPANGVETPSNRVEGLKTAAQWTFKVSEAHQASFAVGYINKIAFTDLDDVRRSPFVSGNVANPFFVAAKRLGRQWHSLVYTGPQIHTGRGRTASWEYDVNSNVHYMVRDSRNFVGVEINKTWAPGDFDMTIRPQMRLQISDQLMVGIVTGVPINRERQRLSMFLRLIYEPRHRTGHP